MTVNLCTVSGTLVAPDGSPMPEVRVQFLPAPVTVRGRAAQTLAPRPVAVTTDAGAELAVSLAPGVYSVRTREPGGREYEPYLVEVPASETAELAEIMRHLPAPQSVYDAAASARVASTAAGAAQESAALVLDALETGGRGFADRAEAESSEVPAALERIALLHEGRILAYRRDPAGTALITADGAHWSPAEAASALHWGAGPSQPATVNTAALNACAAWGRHVHLPAGVYEIDAPVLFAPDEAGGRTACVLRGDGMEATVLVQTMASADAVQFIHADPARQHAIAPQVSDLSIRHPGATTADLGAAIRCRQSLQGSFERIVIDGATFGIVSERSKCWYDKIYFRTSLRAAGEKAQAFLVLDHDPVQESGNSFGTFVSDCESQGAGPGVARMFELRSLDGLYISNSHFNFCETFFWVEPTGTQGRTTVRDVHVSNCYFDYDPSVPLAQAIRLSAEGPAESITLWGFRFSNSLFRGRGPDAAVLRFDTSATGVSGLSFARVFSFIGCEFRHFDGPILDFTLPAAVDARTRLRSITVKGCHFTPDLQSPNPPNMILAGENVVVSGNSHTVGTWHPGAPAIRVLEQSRRVRITGEIIDRPAAPRDLVQIEAGAEMVSIAGLVGRGEAAVEVETVETGIGPEGDAWVKYADGRMVVTRSMTFTGVNVNTAWGGFGLFQSGNLLTATTRQMPVSFAEVPVFQVYLRCVGFLGFALFGGTGDVDEWPASATAITVNSPTNRTVVLDMRAEGRWK